MKTYIFRVVPDIEEDIFRDIEIKATQSFEELHNMIIEAFDFRGDQMASFYMSDEDWEKGEEIGLMDMGFGEESGPKMMSTTSIEEMIAEENQKILYLYDFLKMWIFYVELIDENTSDKAIKYPRIVREIGLSPDEDNKEIPDLLEGVNKGSSFNEDDDEDEIDDIFNEFDDDFEEGFDNIDDYDF